MRPVPALIVAALLSALSAAGALAATPVQPTPEAAARERALVERLTIERANALAANDSRWSAQYADRARRLDAAERAARAARGAASAAAAELARVSAEKRALADEIAAKDVAYAQEIASYRELMTGVVSTASAEKLAALERYAAGDRIGAFPVLQQITQAENEARDKAAAAIAAQADAQRRRANADNIRALGAQALDMLQRGELSTDKALPIWQEVTRLDPTDSWAWIEMGRLAFALGNQEIAGAAFKEALAQADTPIEKIGALGGLSRTQMRLGDHAGARRSLDQSVAIATAVASADGQLVNQTNLISVLLELADVQAIQGDATAAGYTIVRTLQIAMATYQANQSDLDAARMVAWVSFQGAMKLQVMGKADIALESYDLSEKIYQLLETRGLTRQDRLALALVRQQRGNLRYEAGDFAPALADYSSAVGIYEALIAADPADQTFKMYLNEGLNRVGDAQAELGNWSAARAAYFRSLEIARAVSAASPADLEARRNVAVALDRLGAVQMQAGRLDEAKSAFEQAVAIVGPGLEANPRSVVARADMAHFYYRLGQVEEKRQRPLQAAAQYTKSLQLLAALHTELPLVRSFQRDAAEVARDLGQALVAGGMRDDAVAVYSASHLASSYVAFEEPASIAAQRSYAITLYRMARDLGGEGAWAKVVAQFAKVAALGPLTPEDQKQLNEAKSKVAAGAAP